MLRNCGPLRVGGCGPLLLLLCAGLGNGADFWGQSPCPESGFLCDNGLCIWDAGRCNGWDDCGDNSDEIYCAMNECPKGYIKCPNNHTCILPLQTCDGDDNCGDGWDEDPDNCYADYCGEDGWQCPNGPCISKRRLCDGEDSCGDDSDELDCEDHLCWFNQVKCGNNPRCIDDWALCDGKDDCGDGWDEDPDNCVATHCHEDSGFRCANGICRHHWKRCNGKNDCGDNSDETDCDKNPCPVFMVKCPNSRCILHRWLCDGDDDCGDRWDETLVFCDRKRK